MDIIFKWIGSATWILNVNAYKIACDPVLCKKGTVQNYKYFKSTRLTDPLYAIDDLDNVDLWILSHDHEDHFDKEGIIKISDKSFKIIHRSNEKKLINNNVANYKVLSWGQDYNISDQNLSINIEAVPGIHSKFKVLSKLIGNNNGYIIKIYQNNETFIIYYTGDDVFNKKRFEKYYKGKIDLVIANAGAAHIGKGILGAVIGRITNDYNDILNMANSIDSKLIIPIHWGTFSHYLDNSNNYKDSLNKIKIVKAGETVRL